MNLMLLLSELKNYGNIVVTEESDVLEVDFVILFEKRYLLERCCGIRFQLDTNDEFE